MLRVCKAVLVGPTALGWGGAGGGKHGQAVVGPSPGSQALRRLRAHRHVPPVECRRELPPSLGHRCTSADQPKNRSDV